MNYSIDWDGPGERDRQRPAKPLMDTCPTCEGIGSVCLACDAPIDDCECYEDAEPCPCDRCDGRGKVWPNEEPET